MQALAVPALAAIVAGPALWDLGSRNAYRLLYDNQTPLVRTTQAQPEKASTSPGGSFDVHYTYFRRPGCVGSVEYRLEGRPDGWEHDNSFVIARYNAGWPEGDGEQAAHVSIPEHIPPGSYEFVFITRADACEASEDFKASSKPIVGRSLPVVVKVGS